MFFYITSRPNSNTNGLFLGNSCVWTFIRWSCDLHQTSPRAEPLFDQLRDQFERTTFHKFIIIIEDGAIESGGRSLSVFPYGSYLD
jgi:hypothetical protein